MVTRAMPFGNPLGPWPRSAQGPCRAGSRARSESRKSKARSHTPLHLLMMKVAGVPPVGTGGARNFPESFLTIGPLEVRIEP